MKSYAKENIKKYQNMINQQHREEVVEKVGSVVVGIMLVILAYLWFSIAV